jgi:hypothetical protein
MVNVFFPILVGLFLFVLFNWGFRVLPREGWQILASVPREKIGDNKWRGTNYTFYGFLIASAYFLATSLFLLLVFSLGSPTIKSISLIFIILLICVPISGVIAGIIERKRHTFTVGGAVFFGFLLAPLVILFVNRTFGGLSGMHLPMGPILSALVIAYAFGEGLGRLGCISYGCCYGKPIQESHPILQMMFSNVNFVFKGKTKKIAYEKALDGKPVIPIQGITAFIFSLTGLIGLCLFLNGFWRESFVTVCVTTQFWRFLSEFLRKDGRGNFRTLSTYQCMAIFTGFYSIGLTPILPSVSIQPDLQTGFSQFWNAGIILFLQGIWLGIFQYVGKSGMTHSTLSFFIEEKESPPLRKKPVRFSDSPLVRIFRPALWR